MWILRTRGWHGNEIPDELTYQHTMHLTNAHKAHVDLIRIQLKAASSVPNAGRRPLASSPGNSASKGYVAAPTTLVENRAVCTTSEPSMECLCSMCRLL